MGRPQSAGPAGRRGGPPERRGGPPERTLSSSGALLAEAAAAAWGGPRGGGGGRVQDCGGADGPGQISAAVLDLLSHFDVLKEVRSGAQSPKLTREGRRTLAIALGLPPTSAAANVAANWRPLPASAGVRCAALDAPVLAEACSLLRFDREPWPKVHLRRAASARTLAIVGALGCIVTVRRQDWAGQLAGWALHRLAAVLSDLASNRLTSENVASALRNTQMLGARAAAPLGELLPHMPPVGAEVLAHWMLPTGERSIGVEDAVVVSVDQVRLQVGLCYVDGLELEVPVEWIATSPDGRLLCNHHHVPGADGAGEDRWAALAGAEGDAAPPSRDEVPAEELQKADYPLLRLLQVAAPPAEICARARALFDRPRGGGLAALAAALRVALATAPVAGQRACLEALCAFCAAGADEAAAARSFANDILLSGCGRLPATPRQLLAIERAAALTEVQRAKLLVLCRAPAKRMWHDKF